MLNLKLSVSSGDFIQPMLQWLTSSLSSHSTITQEPAHIILLANTDIVVLVLQMVVRFEVVEVVHLPGFKS